MIILASQSQIRSKILSRAGITHKIEKSPFNEKHAQEELKTLTPKALAQRLSLEKAKAVAQAFTTDLVIGADQTLDFEGRCLHKSHDMTAARDCLTNLNGKTHKLHSAICVIKADRVLFEFTATVSLTMRHFSGAFLDDYLQNAGPGILSSVGCYQIEDRGIQLFEDIEGNYYDILGLPLLPLLAFLRKIGELKT